LKKSTEEEKKKRPVPAWEKQGFFFWGGGSRKEETSISWTLEKGSPDAQNPLAGETSPGEKKADQPRGKKNPGSRRKGHAEGVSALEGEGGKSLERKPEKGKERSLGGPLSRTVSEREGTEFLGWKTEKTPVEKKNPVGGTRGRKRTGGRHSKSKLKKLIRKKKKKGRNRRVHPLPYLQKTKNKGGLSLEKRKAPKRKGGVGPVLLS